MTFIICGHYVASRLRLDAGFGGDLTIEEAEKEFDQWLLTVKAETWDEAVEALDRHHRDTYPVAVSNLDRQNPYKGGNNGTA